MQLLPKPQRNNSYLHQAELGHPPDVRRVSAAQAPQILARDRAIEETQSNRIVILIDGSNLFYAATYLGIEIDYVQLLQCLIRGRRLVRAYFYTGVDPANDRQQGFLLWMRRNGYRVVAKELIQFPDGSKKANLEVEIAVDMLMLARYCDTVVLLSGNGNLAYAVNAIAYKGVRIELVSLRSMTNDSLINVSDHYIDLDSIKDDIQRG